MPLHFAWERTQNGHFKNGSATVQLCPSMSSPRDSMKLVQVSAQVWANAASGFMTEPDTPKKKRKM